MNSVEFSEMEQITFLDQWTDDELARLWELYKLDCERAGVATDLSSFHVYLQERV